ncbi:MAG: cytochrome c [Pseudomonadales bacterium]|nr:cytochrome c [Pseudomonadales bacterium]
MRVQLWRALGSASGRRVAIYVQLVTLLLLTSPGWGERLNPDLGEPLTAAEIGALAKTILPDGTGLPAGSGSAAAGGELYAVHCQACHGADGTGGINDRLAGGQGSLAGPAPLLTVGSYWPYATTLFDYVRRAMPYQSPGSLSDDQVYALTAYVLFLNGIVAENHELNARSLPAVPMPNAGGFHSSYTEHPQPSDPG